MIDKAINWYKKLNINQKIGLKECAVLLTGIKWEDYNYFFNPKERLNILYNKLILERIINNEE